MAWRVISTEGSVWHVDPAVERRGPDESWQLVLSFRAVEGAGRKSFWAPFPVESASQSQVFKAAERIKEGELRDVLNTFLS